MSGQDVQQQAELEELETRRLARKSIAAANSDLKKLLHAWVVDPITDEKRFWASGHRGEYTEIPRDTLVRKLEEIGWTDDRIDDAINAKATPLDYMSNTELLAIQRRVIRMIIFFRKNTNGTYAQACKAYEKIGEMVRVAMLHQLGVYPEQLPAPTHPVTGREKAYQFQMSPLDQITIFDEEDSDA